VLLLAAAVAAAMPATASDLYGPVRLRARVVDRNDRPVAGVALRVEARLDGLALRPDGLSGEYHGRFIQRVVTDANGTAEVCCPDPRSRCGRRWFRGRVEAVLRPADQPSPVALLDPDPPRARFETPSATPDAAVLMLRVFESPDLQVGGFPVWLGRDGRLDRVVVMVEGFDLYGDFGAADWMSMLAQVGDPLRRAGLDVLAVDFPDGHLPPDQTAAIVARAVRAAAAASGRPVAVAGVSAGGVVARWALAEAEQAGEPLPAHTFLSLDSPHRGARLNPLLVAMCLRYGNPAQRAAMDNPAARSLLSEWPEQVRWQRQGSGPLGREVPVASDAVNPVSEQFFRRLRALNGNGYPKQCRLLAVSNGRRQGATGAGDLLHLWLPLGREWTMPATERDHVPGSLLPTFVSDGFRMRLPLGLAGSYLRSTPTFIPTESALDAGPDERPPFDQWYARPDDLPPVPHNAVPPDAAVWVIRRLLEAPW